MVTITPVDENNKDIVPMSSLLGAKLLKEAEGTPVPTDETLKGNGMVALYFSASWCPPCQRFTPVLTEFYNAAKKAECGLEIVFVSSDRSLEEFAKYYGKMPWLSMPTEGSADYKNKLAQTLGIRGIPALAVFDAKTGEFIIGGEARDDVMLADGDPEKVKAVIAKWTETERSPLTEAAKLMEVGAGAPSALSKLLSFFCQEPHVHFRPHVPCEMGAAQADRNGIR